MELISGLNYFWYQIKLKQYAQNSFKLPKVSTFNCFFFGLMIWIKSSTTEFTNIRIALDSPNL